MSYNSWWRHPMETFSPLLTLCEGNSPVTGEFPHKGQWRGALMFSLIFAWTNGWVNNRDAGDLRRPSCQLWTHFNMFTYLINANQMLFQTMALLISIWTSLDNLKSLECVLLKSRLLISPSGIFLFLPTYQPGPSSRTHIWQFSPQRFLQSVYFISGGPFNTLMPRQMAAIF